MSSERSFFSSMEEFGFFRHIYEKLPPDFTAVFEIARVLEDESTSLRQSLDQVLRLPSLFPSDHTQQLDDYERFVPAGEEFEADFIRSVHDVSRIYPGQFLLPEQVFLRQLAERTLWMPVAKTPKIIPVEDGGSGFAFDSRKQKVYILFDTSNSMSAHHRIHLAKAILSYFLKRNKEDMGYIALRTFDDHVGDLTTATDDESYHAMLRSVLRLSHLGDGTVLQKALLQALDDLKTVEHLAGAEILIITDGAVTMDESLVRSKMDENIHIHTIKIGNVQIYPSERQIDDMILAQAKNADPHIGDRALIDLLKQEEQLVHLLQYSEDQAKRVTMNATLSHIRAQIAGRKALTAAQIMKSYGHEIERISDLFVHIPDFEEVDRFRADHDTIDDLEALANRLKDEADDFLTPEISKKLAILHDHVNFLLRYETDPELRERLTATDQLLKHALASFIHMPGDTSGPKNGNGGSRHAPEVPLTDEDLRDLRFILEAEGGGGGGGLNVFLRWLWLRSSAYAQKLISRRKAKDSGH